MSDTLIFSIGTFSSKFLVYFLMSLYTRAMTNEQFGVADLIIQTANLMLPIVSVGIFNSVIRFGLDKEIDKSKVFTIGLKTVLSGFGIFLLFYPLAAQIPFLKGYTYLLYLYVLMGMMRSLCSQFVRAKQLTKLYAFDGILATCMVIFFNVLFLVVLDMGVEGYILSTIVSDFLSSVFLMGIARLHKNIKPKQTDKLLKKQMLRYSIPMIPATVFWWITNVSDRYMVAAMISESANGLYAIAYKIPTLINLVSGVFSDAWQISAVTHDNDSPEQAKFFSTVYASFTSLLFFGGSGLILFCKFIMKFMVGPDFFASWSYIPILVIATIFSCFATFLGSVYVVEKKSSMILVTAMAGAITNIVLNFILIPKVGVNGATIATMISYMIIYMIRAYNTRHFIKMDTRFGYCVVNTALLLVQSYFMITEHSLWILVGTVCCTLIAVLNFKPILKGVMKVLGK